MVLILPLLFITGWNDSKYNILSKYMMLE